MTLTVLRVSNTDDSLNQQVASEVVEAAMALGWKIDIQGFVQSWLDGMKVIADRDPQGKIVGLGFMLHGVAWADGERHATLLRYGHMDRSKITDIVKYAKQIAEMLECSLLRMLQIDDVDTNTVGEHYIQSIINFKV